MIGIYIRGGHGATCFCSARPARVNRNTCRGGSRKRHEKSAHKSIYFEEILTPKTRPAQLVR